MHKLVFDLANNYQTVAGIQLTAKDFLEMEECSHNAYGVAVAQSIELLGPNSPVWQHLSSLISDFGGPINRDAKGFETLLKAYALTFPKETGDQYWEALVKGWNARTADRAFRRLVMRNAERLAGLPPGQCTQEAIDKFINMVERGEVTW